MKKLVLKKKTTTKVAPPKEVPPNTKKQKHVNASTSRNRPDIILDRNDLKVPVSFSIPKWVRNRIVELAKDNDMSLTALGCEIIINYIQELDK